MLKDKNIIVTGAGGGIGKAMVRLFVEKGAHVWACCRKPKQETDDFFKQINQIQPGAIDEVYFDMRNTSEISSAVKTIISQKKPIHGLVNNSATLSENQLFLMTPLSTIRDVFEVNFFAQVALTQLVVKNMIRYPEIEHSIVNITSIAALDGEPGQLEYVASKAAMIGMTKKLARELSSYQIRVNAIAPGLTETKMISSMTQDYRHNILAKSIGAKIGKPEEIAHIASFLLSEESMRINAQVIRADG